MKIVIIGTGNVAWHLVNAIQQSTHRVIQLVNLHSHKVSSDFEKFNIPYAFLYTDIVLEADVYIIAISDKEIATLQLPILNNKQIVIHTSGIAEIELLKKYCVNFGCIYPVQTLTKGIPIDFTRVPLIIEASNMMAKEKCMDFALTLSPYVLYLSLHKRQVLHLAAVLVNNFTNQLFVEAKQLLDKESISFDLLKPLLSETISKLNQLHPLDAQTGPAKRNDVLTLLMHENLIEENSLLLQIYKLMTTAIQKQAKN